MIYLLGVADFASVVGCGREADAALPLILTVRTRVWLRTITRVWRNTVASILTWRNTDR